MPAINERVTLTDEEAETLEALLHKGKSAARQQTRARILLKAAAGCQDAAILEALGARPRWSAILGNAALMKASKRPCTTERVPGSVRNARGKLARLYPRVST